METLARQSGDNFVDGGSACISRYGSSHRWRHRKSRCARAPCEQWRLNEAAGATSNVPGNRLIHLVSVSIRPSNSNVTGCLCVRWGAPARARPVRGAAALTLCKSKRGKQTFCLHYNALKGGCKKKKKRRSDKKGVIANGKEIVLIESPILAFKRQRMPYSGLPTMQQSSL